MYDVKFISKFNGNSEEKSLQLYLIIYRWCSQFIFSFVESDSENYDQKQNL